MIISHKHKFIFIKTNKTAGTSIEIALSGICGINDIITPLTSEDEKLRRELGFLGPQNYILRDSLFAKLKNKFNNKDVQSLRYYNHISASEIKNIVGAKIWKNYYKFCFERNPCDRLISLYYWKIRNANFMTVDEFFNANNPYILKKKGINLYTIDGKIAVDKVYLYERMEEAVRHIEKSLNLEKKLTLPKAKASFRKDKRGCKEFFNEDQITLIREMFSTEIERFGYEI